MRYDPYPPYTILANREIPFSHMQGLVRFARFWDMIANSGRFKHSLKLVLAEQPFENFMALTDWLFKQAGATHKIALDRLANLVTRYLVEQRGMDKHEVQVMIGKDYAGDARHVQSPELMQDKRKNPHHGEVTKNASTTHKALPKRQARHTEVEKY